MAIAPQQLVKALMEERVKIHAYIRSIVPDYHIAEDVYQEVSMLAFQELENIQDRTHLMAWVRRAARHRAINASKKHHRKTLLLEGEVLEAIEASWQRLDDQPNIEVSEALEKCINLLSPSARRLVHLRYTEGLTGDALAGMVKRPTPSCYVTLSRIHKSLKKCMTQRLGRPLTKGAPVV